MGAAYVNLVNPAVGLVAHTVTPALRLRALLLFPTGLGAAGADRAFGGGAEGGGACQRGVSLDARGRGGEEAQGQARAGRTSPAMATGVTTAMRTRTSESPSKIH